MSEPRELRLEPAWKARIGDWFARDDMQALSAFPVSYTHLDVYKRQAEIMDLFASLPERGTSVLIASHDLGLVKRMKKRVLVLDHGRLADDIAPEDLADE